MRRAGRALVRTSISILQIYACLTVAGGVDYGVPVEIKVWDTGRTPLAHMVDVTNGFGLKVLAEHNFLNDNNIAFSPYGLMGIIVALYEGVDGESSYQIQRAMHLPWNRNVMRIGFRDIHRTLKTYFVPEEGFLAGLALNNENVTFNDSYKKILRFYGFDLENDQLPTLPPANSTTNDTTSGSSMAGGSETTPMTTVAMVTESKPAETSTVSMREETTTNPNAETINVDVRAPTEATTITPSSAPSAESTTATITQQTTTVVSETTTQIATEAITTQATLEITITTTIAPSTDTLTPSTTSQASSTTQVPSTTTQLPITTTGAPTTTQTSSTNVPNASEADTMMTTIGTTNTEPDAETIAQQTSQATSALTAEPTTNNDLMTTTDMGSSMAESTSLASTTGITDMTESLMTTSMSDTPTDGSTTLADMTTTIDSSATTIPSTLETLQRRKRSIVDFIFTNPPFIDDYFFYRSYHVGPDIPSPGFDDKMFLANGLKSVQVTYMHYNTVLEHAYLPHLEASALRLPLDSERYYLLVVLPNRGGSAELSRLLFRMARESDLADVYAALRPRRVRAVVPSFIVKGHVTLTTDLQKLGIRDVFEPRQRDFTPMTRQVGVYVRSIEQAVSVAIRKYRPDDHKKNRYVSNRDPVTFSATYPFLYFVMDATIHVALMAGKMVDPLNSRIL